MGGIFHAIRMATRMSAYARKIILLGKPGEKKEERVNSSVDRFSGREFLC
jgi:hypothetical protein